MSEYFNEMLENYNSDLDSDYCPDNDSEYEDINSVLLINE